MADRRLSNWLKAGRYRPSRRALLGALAGGWVAGGLTACGDDDDPGSSSEPTATADLSPTPTQEPIGTPIGGYVNPDRYRGRTLTVATPTGPYADAQREAYFDPFQQATGAEVFSRGLGSGDGDLKGQVDSDVVTWDVACVPMDWVRPLANDGYLTEIDRAYVDVTVLIPEVVGQYAIGADLFSTVIVYPVDAPNIPSNWTDFWNVESFGEGRSLRKRPVGTLEFALLADGVSRDELYPLDVERAFASLEKIKPHIVQWWEDGKQPAELVANAQAGLASSWNIRADLQTVREEVRIQWTGGMLSADAWVVPRGAPNLDIAMDFINYATRAVPQANFSRLLPYGPVNPAAFEHIREDRLPMLPSAQPQFGLQFFENWNYWIDNLDLLTERFNDWLESDTEPEGTPGA
jgi:putative spermidine/putrescine transport system substrate-binding protein